MTTKREAISKKTRFEVLKRDGFKCQYCGKAAPEAILHVDHINPVAKGGGKEILNLITACSDCNLGKKDIKLDDQSTLAKQRKQAEELEKIRQQKVLMADWVKELREAAETELKEYEKYLDAVYSISLSDFGKTLFTKALKKYGLHEVLTSTDISADAYLKDKNSETDKAKFLMKIERICYYREKDRKDPEGAKIRKIVNIAARKWFTCNRTGLLIDLNRHLKSGITPEELEKVVISSTGIMAFDKQMKEFYE